MDSLKMDALMIENLMLSIYITIKNAVSTYIKSDQSQKASFNRIQ